MALGDGMNAGAKGELLAVLRAARDSLVRPGNDFAWSAWDDTEEAVAEIDGHIAAIERGDVSKLDDLNVLFLPTGSIQEVSLSSGWGEEFCDLASRFDKALEKVRG